MTFNRTNWSRENRKFYSLSLMLSTDSELIAFLDSLENKQSVIKKAIKEYMLNHQSDDSDNKTQNR